MTLHPLNKIKIIGTLVGMIAIGLIVGIKTPDHATATANDNVHGWLWSDMPDQSDQSPNKSPMNQFGGRGLGYISLNNMPPHNSTPPPGVPLGGSYGVRIDPVTGDISGAGWSEYGGWLDFDPIGGFPTAAPGTAATSAKIMPTCWTSTAPADNVCPVIGWARFFVGNQPITTQWGGWDGWVSLYTNSTTTPSYKVFYNKTTKKFSGNAWGGMVAGWINFDNAFAIIDTQLPVGVCTDPNATNYKAPPLAPLEFSDPSQCMYTADNDNYVCSLEFSPNTNTPASNYEEPPYTTGQIPTPNVCLFPGCTNQGANNYNKDANISDPNNPCQFKPGEPGGPGGSGGPGGPIKPIYKEN